MSTNTNFQQIIQQATINLRIDRHVLDDMIEVHPILYNNVFRHMQKHVAFEMN